MLFSEAMNRHEGSENSEEGSARNISKQSWDRSRKTQDPNQHPGTQAHIRSPTGHPSTVPGPINPWSV